MAKRKEKTFFEMQWGGTKFRLDHMRTSEERIAHCEKFLNMLERSSFERNDDFHKMVKRLERYKSKETKLLE